MGKISVHLLGRPYVEVDGERINFPYKKAEGFFYYLCVKKKVTREEIIYVLWGADNENVGRKNLREAVYQIKKLLGKEILVTEGHTSISLNPDCMPDVDWDHITEENILDNEDEGILAHFHIKNSYEFEEWVASMQEQYSRTFVECARQQLSAAGDTKDAAQIQKYSNILLKHDPYNESLYYEIMDIYAANGSYNMAIKLYYDLQNVLQEDLGVEPSPEITELFHRIFNVKGNMAADKVNWKIPFTGRTEEIYEISECLTGVGKDKQPQCVAIGGEVGVGKSALLEKARQMVGGYQKITLHAACYQEESEFFLRSWNDIFWEIDQWIENGILDSECIKEQKERLNQFFSGSLLDQEGNVKRLTYQFVEQAILDLFRKIVEKRKVVLFFDDIQWMDSMSIQLLNRLLLTFGTDKILLMCTYNQNHDIEVMEALDKLNRKGWLHVINLCPFSIEETNELLHKYLPQLDDEVQKRENIYQMTDGNAFFLLEMIGLIKEKGYTLENSQKVKNVIKARLAGLPKEENEILDVMSLFPEKIAVEEIEFLIPNMDRLTLLHILEELQERHLIRETLVGWNVYYQFVHRAFKEYIYERQSVGKKRVYHQMLAEYYEAKKDGRKNFSYLPMIIHHYERCHNRVKTYQYKIEYLEEYYRVINENFPVLHWEIEYASEDFGMTAHADELVKLADEVIQFEDTSCQAQEMKMEMSYVKGRYDIATGNYESGINNIERSIHIAERLGNTEMLLDNYRQMVFYGIQVEDYERAEMYVEEGLRIIGIANPIERASFLRLKGCCQIYRRQFSDAERTLVEAACIFRTQNGESQEIYKMSLAACYNYIGDIFRCKGEYEDALKYYEEAIAIGSGIVVTNGLGQFYSSAGQVLYDMEEYYKAKEYLEKSISCLSIHGYLWGQDRAEAYLARVLLKIGNLKDVKEHYENSRNLSERIKNPTTLMLLEDIKKEMESC